jgi:hypothetical protein
LKRPRKRAERFPNKPKFLVQSISAEELEAAAVGAKYAPSDYHCKIDGRLKGRTKPATPCPRIFTYRKLVTQYGRQYGIGEFPASGLTDFRVISGTRKVTFGTRHALTVELPAHITLIPSEQPVFRRVYSNE